MPRMSQGYWFRSARFHVEPDEDAETNPGIFGKQLAAWLACELRGHGYPEAEEVPEDWGWAVVCQAKPLYLYAGCSNMLESIGDGGPRRVNEGSIIWHVFAAADTPLFARLRGIDVESALQDLDALLLRRLTEMEGITLTSHP